MSDQTSAVQVLEPSGVTFNLDKFPTDKFNRLIPTQTINMPSDLVVPVVQVVQLDIANDAYESPDVPRGSRAISRVGLRKLATAAGVSIFDERRTDDGTAPDVCEITCIAEMILPTGQRLRAPGMKRVDLRRQKWASDAQRAKYASFFQEHVASRAENRAIRALLSLRASYPVSELARPFAVVTFAPNMNHPEVRARALEAMVPSVPQLYGPEQPRQLGAGAIEAPIQVAQAPDDDEPPNGERPAAPEPEDVPDWSRPADPVTGEVIEDPGAAFGRTLTDKVDAARTGLATDEQRKALSSLFAGRIQQRAQLAVLASLWSIDPGHITEGQAAAILELATILSYDTFAGQWNTLARSLG